MTGTIKPLPCPYCGAEEIEAWDGSANFMECQFCQMTGPHAPSESSAIDLWNKLPRSLKMTHEPPKQPDQYYWANDSNLMALVVRVVDINGTLLAKIPGSNEACPLSDFVEWSDRPLIYPLEES